MPEISKKRLRISGEQNLVRTQSLVIMMSGLIISEEVHQSSAEGIIYYNTKYGEPFTQVALTSGQLIGNKQRCYNTQ